MAKEYCKIKDVVIDLQEEKDTLLAEILDTWSTEVAEKFLKNHIKNKKDV